MNNRSIKNHYGIGKVAYQAVGCVLKDAVGLDSIYAIKSAIKDIWIGVS